MIGSKLDCCWWGSSSPSSSPCTLSAAQARPLLPTTAIRRRGFPVAVRRFKTQEAASRSSSRRPVGASLTPIHPKINPLKEIYQAIMSVVEASLGTIKRGGRNVARNPMRLALIVALLGTGLMFVAAMFALNGSAQQRLQAARDEIGTGIDIRPSG